MYINNILKNINRRVSARHNFRTMKTIKKMIKHYKQEMNLTPFKTVKLKTGIICQHYRNGTIKVI